MKTAVRRVLLMSALLSPTALYALGLGEIRLNSALNQPFDAEIELVSAAAEDLAALRASLASSDTFARYGLDRPAYLADFTFRVVHGADGRDVLHITSPRPVTEPFVTLLVEANWPRGRLLREYTVLLDPPVFAPSPAAGEAPVAAPRATAPAPAVRRSEPVAPAPSPSEPEQPPAIAAPTIQPGSSYRVQRNDTLWKIASEINPGTRSDVNRAMVAIYQANPEAFDGNINVLKAGSLISIPAAAEMSSISASAAAAEVSRQYRMWREANAAAAGETGEGGRLRLVTPEQGTPTASTATVQPAPAAGTPDTALQSRVQQLESELAEARRLLEVRNAELATLQGQQPVTEPTAEPAAETPVAEAPAEPAAEPALEPAAEPVAEAPLPAPVEEAPAVEKKPAPPVEEGPSLMERLAGYWWVLLGLLAAALAFMLVRRSRGSAAAEDDLAEALARREPADLRARPSAAPKARESEILVEERRPVEMPVGRTGAPVAVPDLGRKPSIDDTLSGEAPASVEAGDPLAEADFHMAYGLYDQAADLVQVAARREPRRRDLKLKLLEIFFVWGNRERFLEIAREMSATRSAAQPGEWDKVLIMGKQIAPEDALFAGVAPSADAGLDMELHSAAGSLDMDLGSETGSITDIDLTGVSPQITDEASLDFVLDEPTRGEDELSSLSPTVETARLPISSLEEPTQEVSIEDLGFEAGDLQDLADVEGADDIFAPQPKAVVEDTIERPTIAHQAKEPVADMLSSTSIMKGLTETVQILPGVDDTVEDTVVSADQTLGAGDETSLINFSDTTGVHMISPDATGELPTIEPTVETTKLTAQDIDFALGEEAATMSEVGTKLDLARAYIDMGDPEGARSILEEVLKEGNAAQKLEAQRLVSNLP